MTTTPPPEDRTPEDRYIKVYAKELRRLIRENGLRRAEVAELLLLALYIDEEGTCYPSKAELVEKIGMKSPHWSRKLQQRLKRKGVLEWDFDHAKRSPRFHLPSAFYFGSDSYRVKNSESSRDRNHDPKRLYNRESKSESDQNQHTDRNQDQRSERKVHHQEPISARRSSRESASEATKTRESTVGQAPVSSVSHASERAAFQASSGLVKNDTNQQIKGRLLRYGVREKEAALISQQFSAQEIDEVLLKLQRSRLNVRNPGGWIRRALENNAGRLIQYSNSTIKLTQVNQQLDYLATLFRRESREPALEPICALIDQALDGSTAALNRVKRIAAGQDDYPSDLLRAVAKERDYATKLFRLNIRL